MEDNELRLKRSIEYIIEDSDEDKADRIMSLFDTVTFNVDEVIELCKDHATIETDWEDERAVIDGGAVKERLGL